MTRPVAAATRRPGRGSGWRRWLPVVAAFAALAPVVVGGDAPMRAPSLSRFGALAGTTTLGLTVAVAATGLAVLLAHTQHAYAFRGRRVIDVLCLAPLALPPFGFAVALIVMFGQGGLAVRWWGVSPVPVYGFAGLALAGTLSCLPLTYLLVRHRYGELDTAVTEAAADLGASPWQVFRLVTWVRLRPVVRTVFLLAFVRTVTDLATPLVLGGDFPVLPTRIYQSLNAESDVGGAVALAVALTAMVLLVRLTAGVDRELPAVRDAAGPLSVGRRPGPLGRVAVAAAGAVAVVVAVPLVVVAVAAFVQADASGLTGAHVAEVFTGTHARALVTSVFFALLAAPLATASAGALALLADRRTRRGPAVHTAVAVLRSVPGVALGLGAYLAMTGAVRVAGPTGIVLAGGLAILVVHVLHAGAPLALEGALAVESRPRALTEAARSLGARRRDLLAVVHLPALAPVLTAGALTAFVRSLTAVSTVVFLAGLHFPLLPLRALVAVDGGRLGEASAMCAVLAVLALLAAGAALAVARTARPVTAGAVS